MAGNKKRDIVANSRISWQQFKWRGSAWTRVRALLSLGMVFSLSAAGTVAYWVDNATATSGAFSAASLDLQVNDSYASTWSLAGSGLMPGSTVASTLTVQNKGGVGFGYTAKINATGDSSLAQYIAVTARAGATLSGGTCTGGTQIGSTTLAVGTSKPFISTARTLTSSSSEILCFQAQLSSAVSKTVSGKAVKAVVEFTATAAS
ncbi:hypothetical protein NCCP2495_14730 [Dietzia sp. NCCP-2495]|uniref:CalY family protein n=1 Tax=Dietzia sp. NCCP-2495 TaxID=2934675 RepID=UPI002230AA65|nr:CalY family protein [Dietzia sp. NCCP-2495]GLB63594.1 hypothetical protein NCCP2495_14730 [Dietzia sp. NCCP-2495]